MTRSLSRLLRFACLAALASPFSQAQQLERVAHPDDETVDTLDQTFNIDLSSFLALPEVIGPIVILETDRGPIPLELLDDFAPNTVTNFLSYVDDESYDGSIIHRSARDSQNNPFVIQGGGFTAEIPIDQIESKGYVANEFDVSNLRGTVAMAKLGQDITLNDGTVIQSEDTATNQWFVNMKDNSANLDTQNGGFTVFARVIGTGMDVADEIAGLIRYDLDGPFSSGPFDETPLERELDSDITVEDFVAIPKATRASLFPSAESDASFVTFTDVTSSNDAAVGVPDNPFNGSELTLTVSAQNAGASEIVVTASDPNGNTVTLEFTLTVVAATLSFDQDQRVMDHAAQSYELNIESNAAWELPPLPSWVSATPTSGDGNQTITLEVTANASLAPRGARIAVLGKTHTLLQRPDVDSWLANYFTPTEINDMGENPLQVDSDGDGLSNAEEMILFSDPSDSESKLEIALMPDGSNLKIAVYPVMDFLDWELLGTDDHQTWAPVAEADFTFSSNEEAESGTLTATVSGDQSRLYRVHLSSNLFE